MKKWLTMLIFFLGLVSACTPAESSILNDNTCDAPCWRGITPGFTTKEEVQLRLMDMMDVDQGSIIETEVNSRYWQDGIGWSFLNSAETGGAFYFHEKKVIFLISSFKKSWPLSDVVEKYGDPDYVYATYGVVESMMKNVSLIYSDGICIEISTRNIKAAPNDSVPTVYSVDILKSAKVESIELIDPNLTSDQINTACYWPLEEAKIQNWEGYGSYILFRN